MIKKGDMYRLKIIDNGRYEVVRVNPTSVVLKSPKGNSTLVSNVTLNRDYKKEK